MLHFYFMHRAKEIYEQTYLGKIYVLVTFLNCSCTKKVWNSIIVPSTLRNWCYTMINFRAFNSTSVKSCLMPYWQLGWRVYAWHFGLAWPQLWNFKVNKGQLGVDFCSNISFKIFYLFDFHWIQMGHQNFQNLESVSKTKYANKMFFWTGVLKKNIRKIKIIFNIENWHWKSDLGTFWCPILKSRKVKSKKHFSKVS